MVICKKKDPLEHCDSQGSQGPYLWCLFSSLTSDKFTRTGSSGKGRLLMLVLIHVENDLFFFIRTPIVSLDLTEVYRRHLT